MIKSYNQRFYPNPFRHQNLKKVKEQYEVFEDVRKKLKPFLTEKFYEIHEYLDEFGELKSEIRVFRILKERIKNKLANITSVKNILTNSVIRTFEEQTNFENYQKNLRYLELPVQPLVDKKGFESQALSGELVEQAIDEIEDGFGFIYEYCTNALPDSVEMWNDYALFNENDFPFISHDDLLEGSYEIFDKIFDDLQKNSVNLFHWVTSGDLNNRVLKIIKPKIHLTRINYLFTILESLLGLGLLVLIIKYLVSNYKLIFKINDKKLSASYVRKVFRRLKKNFTFRKARMEYKLNKLSSNLERINMNTKIKYNVLHFIIGKSI